MKLTGISVPAAPLLAGEAIDITITATNQASNPTGPVSLSLVATDEATGEAQTAVPGAIDSISANGSSTTTIAWDTEGLLPGTYTLRVAAAADGDTDDTNDAASLSVKLVNALSLVEVSPKTVTAIVGNPIKFTVQVKNLGNDELEDVTVSLFETGGTEAVANAAINAIAVGTTSSTVLTWDTTGQEVDNRSLAIFVGADGQDSDDDDSQWVTVHLRNPITLTVGAATTTSRVVGGPVTIGATVTNAGSDAVNGVVGGPVTIGATVTNAGSDAVNRVVVSLFAGDPAKMIDTDNIDALAAGATATVNLVWSTSGAAAGEHTLQVAAALSDYSEDIDDRADVVVILAEPVVDLAFAGSMNAPAAIVVGNAMTVSANLTNLGNKSESASVGLYIDDATEPVATADTAAIEPGSTETISVEWGTVGPDSLVGERRLRLTAEAPYDTDPANNTITSPVIFYLSAFDEVHAPEECVEDVAVDVAIHALEGQLADPRDYRPDDSLYVGYQIYNYSCDTDAMVKVDLTTVQTDVSIVDGTDACSVGCLVPAGGRVDTEVLWPLTGIPYTIGETVRASIAVSSPEGFADADVENDTATASQRINIVHTDDITLGIGAAEGGKGKIKDQLDRPEFGFVDLVLHSANLEPATVLHSDVILTVTVEVSNKGGETEPAAIDVARAPSDGSAPQVLHTKTIMVKPGDEPKKSIFEVPTDELVVGAQNVQVELTAVNNKATSSNAKQFEVNRLAPTVTTDVELVSIVSTPPAEAMQGQWVEIHVTARNNGSTPVNVPIQLTFPSEDKRPEQKSPRILPGETAVIPFTWKTRDYEPGPHVLRAQILLENNLAIGDTSAELLFLILPPTIAATILEISTVPDAPVVGEPVSITVLVRNDGPVAANIPVTLHFPSPDKQPETRSPRVGPSTTATATFAWRTSDYLPGRHTFRVEVPSTSPSEQRFTVELLPAPINVSIVGISAEPAGGATRGEEVEIHVTARNDGSTPINVPIKLTFPYEDKRPERKSPLIPPGETAVVSFTWKTGNYEPGLHVLRAEIILENNLTIGDTSAELQFILNSPVTTATILEISTVPEAPVVGQAVAITVSVRNDGPIASNIPVTLHFPSADKSPETRSPRAAPGATATANFTWRTSNYLPGTHTFRVEVPSTSRSEHRFAVELLPAPISVSIVGISAEPVGSATRGEEVEIHVTARNDGNTPVNVPIQLTFPAEDKRPERKSSRILPGETAVVSFTWKTRDYEPGLHVLRAEIILENNLTIGDTSAELQFILNPPVTTATILEISTVPEAPVVGQAVDISVLVRNDGPIASNIPVTLHFPSADKSPETRSPRAAPGATATANFTWRTGNYPPGTHTFRVEVPSTSRSEHLFTVELLPVPINVSIVGISAEPAGSATQGDWVEIWVAVRNDGPVAVRVPVELTFPSNDKLPERKSLRIQPGQTARVTFTWKTAHYDVGQHVLVATILSEANAAERNTSAQLQFRLTASATGTRAGARAGGGGGGAGASAAIGATPTPKPPVPTQPIVSRVVEIAARPQSPVVGEPVTITIEVSNDGSAVARIPVTLHFPSADKQPETRRPRVAPGTTGTATFTWRTSRYAPGTHRFRVEIGAGGSSGRRFTIELLPPAADFSVVEIYSPSVAHPVVKGDWVEVAALVRNLGPHQGRTTIHVYNETERKAIYSKSLSLGAGESRVVAFTWKTLRYSEGENRIFILSNAAYDENTDNDRSQTAIVNILTNRDITVGFRTGNPPDTMANATSVPSIRTTAAYLDEILVLGSGSPPAGRVTLVPPSEQIGAQPQRHNQADDPVLIPRLRQSAQTSATDCVRLQMLLGQNQPRGVLCPNAPTLIR